MSKVLTGMTVSLDGYYTGPNDGPGTGLGEGGERLHYWVFGGPWTYGDGPRGEPSEVDKEYLDEVFSTGNWGKVQPVTRVEKRAFQPGPLYHRARELYWDFAHST